MRSLLAMAVAVSFITGAPWTAEAERGAKATASGARARATAFRAKVGTKVKRSLRRNAKRLGVSGISSGAAISWFSMTNQIEPQHQLKAALIGGVVASAGVSHHGGQQAQPRGPQRASARSDRSWAIL
jgi:uncharacterized membrane protein